MTNKISKTSPLPAEPNISVKKWRCQSWEEFLIIVTNKMYVPPCLKVDVSSETSELLNHLGHIPERVHYC